MISTTVEQMTLAAPRGPRRIVPGTRSPPGRGRLSTGRLDARLRWRGPAEAARVRERDEPAGRHGLSDRAQEFGGPGAAVVSQGSPRRGRRRIRAPLDLFPDGPARPRQRSIVVGPPALAQPVRTAGPLLIAPCAAEPQRLLRRFAGGDL